MSTELQDTDENYGSWEYSIADALEEEKRLNPREKLPEVWPDWTEGVPKNFRRWIEVARRKRGIVTYHPTSMAFDATLEWGKARKLSEVRKNYSWLPSTHWSEWAGVYRIFVADRKIGRLLGLDETGTLYVGMAGQGPSSWSIMRSRLMSAAKRNHHVTERWWYDHTLSQAIPWNSVQIEWAYTRPFVDYLGDEWPVARRAESWLLRSYRDSYGEYPPMNEKG